MAVAGGLVVALAVAVGIGLRADATPGDPVVGSVALAALVASPGVLALLGLRSRPDLWLPAGWTAVPLAFVSPLFFPVLVPAAAVVLWAWVRRPSTATRPRAPTAAACAAVLGLLTGAVIALLFTPDDPVSWTDGTTSGSSSDVITTGEGLTGLLATALALAAGWVLTRPVPDPSSAGRQER